MPLNVSSCTTAPEQMQVDVLALGVFVADDIAGCSEVAWLDTALKGALRELLERKEFTGKKDQMVVFDTLGFVLAKRVLLFGMGEKSRANENEERFRVLGFHAAKVANQGKFTSVAVAVQGALSATQARSIAEGLVLGAYRFTKYLTGDRQPKSEIQTAIIIDPQGQESVANQVQLGAAIGTCVTYARDLVNEPPNELTPIVMAQTAEKVAQKHKLACKVFTPDDMKQMGMGLYLAVAQGSANPARLIHLTYNPAKSPEKPASKRLVFVGKGLTFDSGGLCIKPTAGMSDMKSDMSGAANVIALMAAVAELAPDIEVHGIAAAAENMPDGAAYRPADVVRAMNGKTVEVVNTDAEGRMVLADTLTYALSLEPTAVVCNATLTGACIVALGQKCAGYFANNAKLGLTFQKAFREVGEQFWPLPLLRSLRDQLKSDVADLKHTGDRWAGAITAALFLAEFVDKTPFIHCDIAGTALADKSYSFYTKGGTAQGVLSFLRLVEIVAAADDISFTSADNDDAPANDVV